MTIHELEIILSEFEEIRQAFDHLPEYDKRRLIEKLRTEIKPNEQEQHDFDF